MTKSHKPDTENADVADLPAALARGPPIDHAGTTVAPQDTPQDPPKDPPRANLTVVGIGASAGGLDACRRLLDALPAVNGMAFILVQHLDPHHESMMVELLASHTAMTVIQASEGAVLAPDHVYVIPPGSFLSVTQGALHLSAPLARHGARLPFDFLLRSMAEDFGPRAVCVVLSGSGSDGSLGLRAIKGKGGLVIAQDLEEANFDGMPRSAVETGSVDHVLQLADIPAVLNHFHHHTGQDVAIGKAAQLTASDWLQKIIELLRTKTTHDFTLYKSGTLRRRIERRMGMAALSIDDREGYLAFLTSDPHELDLLAKDLLINVTSFFRDAKVFEMLSETILPDLVAAQGPDQPLRIWIAACSSGEEAYSIAMVCREAIAAAKLTIKLQIFASDVDPDAVATAREGLYPTSIKAEVSADRLARFFTLDDHGYRVTAELRAVVVFTIQDVLADPPFSRLDMISCRNLMIYLGPEAQTKLISVFHFALRKGGILLLGSAETVGAADGRFDVISKPARLYRHTGRPSPGELGFSIMPGEAIRVPARPGQGQVALRHSVLADLCRRLVIETYAPAAVLINQKNECLFSLGPTNRYLHVASGHPTHDLLAMAPDAIRTKIRLAIQRATQSKSRILVTGCETVRDGQAVTFGIDVQPVLHDGEALSLICFVDHVPPGPKLDRPYTQLDVPRVAELEQELDTTRTELQGAIRNLEVLSEEQRAVNEEALSVNEEFQSTNEELLTSKEELQALNEELTALNSQLQETLERQRTTSDDLQNILYSTDVATLFLDTSLKIRFFTPATKSLFNVIPGDVGRPLSDLNSLAADTALAPDARAVLQNALPIEREIETGDGAWFMRRILPYRTHANGVEGVVITFTDITERKSIAKALEEAKSVAERATVAKSRFLAAASHDLRQPLQTLFLLQGLLTKSVEGEKNRSLLNRLDETLGAMSGMLNTLLDINKIAAGAVQAHVQTFPINELLGRMQTEFSYHAQAKQLELRVVPCSVLIDSDAALLEQMLRNLLSNAVKYTDHGKILLGCRRRGDALTIKVYDTGIGIPDGELQSIFDEYHQIDNAARERSRGLGLGLSIVQRLANLLGHRLSVRSKAGTGSVFSIEIKMLAVPGGRLAVRQPARPQAVATTDKGIGGVILIVEDDTDVKELLEQTLRDAGHLTVTAPHGIAALAQLTASAIKPDVILADFNLPKGLTGLEFVAKLRAKLEVQTPAIILTGDISADTLRLIAQQGCVQLNKPVKLTELVDAIQRLLPRGSTSQGGNPNVVLDHPAVVFVVDDDAAVRTAIRNVLEDDGQTVQDFSSCEAFLATYQPGSTACLLIDANLPDMTGVELLERLQNLGHRLPAIMITGSSDVDLAVQAMKAGAVDYIEKPFSRADLMVCVQRALEQSRDQSKVAEWREAATAQLASLTSRQREVMNLVLAGHPSKNIAADLGLSQRTVENHRAAIMSKTGAKSLPELARLALAATPAPLAD
jgi:two-component system, chemotaxis family, CheB/CheR fusion protein